MLLLALMDIDNSRFKLSWTKRLALTVGVALGYVLLGNVSFLLASYSSSLAPFWLPSGFALAMVLVYGVPQVIGAVVVGVVLLGLQTWTGPLSILGLSISEVVEVSLAALLFRALDKSRFSLKCPKDVIGFIVIAATLCPFVSSAIAITFLSAGSFLQMDEVPQVWVSYFLGNSLGILLFCPLILSCYGRGTRRTNVWELLLLSSALGAAAFLAIGGPHVRKLLLMPLLVWSALRFGFRGIGLAMLFLGYVAVWASRNHSSFLGVASPGTEILLIQIITTAFTSIGYLLATVTEAQSTAQKKELELSINLQHKKIAEEALAILDQSLHKSPIGFALIDRDYRFIRINEAAALLNGMPADDHLGKKVQMVTHEYAPKIISLIDEVFATGGSLMNLPFRKHGEGGKGLLAGLVSYYPVRHPTTYEIFAVAVSFQDITEQLRIQNLMTEHKERLRFAQEAGKIGAFEWDLGSQRLFWTPEMEAIYGFRSGEFSGVLEAWLDLIHPSDLERVRRTLALVVVGEGELNIEFKIVNRQGEERWILVRGKTHRPPEEGKEKLIGISIDLTEQKLIEEKLRLTETNLLKALEVRDEFLAIASHELKTPLTSLKLQLQMFQRTLLRDGYEERSPDPIHAFVERSGRQVDRLTRLVDDMLDISRIRTGKLTLKKEHCDLTQMLQEIIARNREQLTICGSGEPEFHKVEDVFGMWDPLRIDQVLTNIISNAIRYGLGRPITIGILRTSESVQISIKDRGQGIQVADQTKIFERYERGILSREDSGLGLGLFITKQIVEAHGGKIWVESAVQQGATFYVVLPALPLSPLSNLLLNVGSVGC